jgi:hypothetical protein
MQKAGVRLQENWAHERLGEGIVLEQKQLAAPQMPECMTCERTFGKT